MNTKFTHRRRVRMDELTKKSFSDLLKTATAQNVVVQSNLSKWEIAVQILRSAYNSGAQISGEGTLKVMPQGFGLIRAHHNLELPLPSDVYIAPSQVKSQNLKDGVKVSASVRPPNKDESYFAVKDILAA